MTLNILPYIFNPKSSKSSYRTAPFNILIKTSITKIPMIDAYIVGLAVLSKA